MTLFSTNLYFQLHHSNTINFASVSYFNIFFIFFRLILQNGTRADGRVLLIWILRIIFSCFMFIIWWYLKYQLQFNETKPHFVPLQFTELWTDLSKTNPISYKCGWYHIIKQNESNFFDHNIFAKFYLSMQMSWLCFR